MMLTLRLDQRKLVTSAQRYCVASQAVSVDPVDLDKLRQCFVIQPAVIGTDTERLVRVGSLTDIDDAGIPVNALTWFRDLSVDIGAVAQTGDVLTVTAPPEEWNPGSPCTFTVKGVAATRMEATSPFWWKTTGLAWSLDRGSTHIASGTEGCVERADTSSVLYKADRWLGAYADATQALDHLAYIQTMIKSLVDVVAANDDVFRDLPTASPITLNIVPSV